MSESGRSGKRPPAGPPAGPMGMGSMEQAKDFKGGIRKLLSYMKPFKGHLIVVAMLAVAASIFTIIGPKILAMATDELAAGVARMMKGAESGIDFGYIGTIGLVLIGLYLISAAFGYIQGHVMSGVSTRISYNLRNALMRKINRMPLGYFHRNSQGDVLSRITNDIDTVEQSLSQSITQLLTSAATLIGVIVMMLTISWQMTLIAIVMVPVSLVLVATLVKLSQKHFVSQQQYLGRVNGQVEEIYGGHVVMKAFNGEQKALEAFDTDNEKLAASAKKAEFLSGLMMPVMQFVGNLGYVVICIVGASLAAGGSVSIGGIQAFIQYVRSFTQPIIQIANISSQLQRMAAAAERVFEFLDEPEEEEHPVTAAADEAGLQGHIRFDHVKFGYDSDKLVIKDFSIDVKAGQRVAIVGPTGAGKTTIVKLLMRFHELSGGVIYMDGHSLTEFSRQDLRSKFGMVLQDTWLFTGTIMDNIRYGRLGATDEEVYEAAREAQADHFVRTLPGGYQMELNEETSNVSQGQKQLLTIARAILADPKVLILDEATSSVDTRTEILIQKAMDKLMEGRTSFIIAHRLSTIRGADIILCMNEGDIIEQGTHDELMARGGFYANLYNSQFEQAEMAG
ncbi:ABC transporter ATP-binding protein [Paenibacillus sambharensis]|uniref:ABC transporter ATP-binding protein n=1 Tax=Paenibacillus sambharensis TaxID=1803190 RepID=A0A2W1LT63_9BACL|nr:ABC transporter ATP-binding protein [Paenibacillus sambharensis]PZD95031.1 ABC transporter ATP-binding protein [Paenibacillus sambharensis]